jgi:hypothetical protein
VLPPPQPPTPTTKTTPALTVAAQAVPGLAPRPVLHTYIVIIHSFTVYCTPHSCAGAVAAPAVPEPAPRHGREPREVGAPPVRVRPHPSVHVRVSREGTRYQHDKHSARRPSVLDGVIVCFMGVLLSPCFKPFYFAYSRLFRSLYMHAACCSSFPRR